VRFRLTERLEPDRAAWLLAFDKSRRLAALLFLTGGLQKSVRVPVSRAGADFGDRAAAAHDLMLGAFRDRVARRFWCSSLSVAVGRDDPLVLAARSNIDGPVWFSILLAIGFIGVYAWRCRGGAGSCPPRWRPHRAGAHAAEQHRAAGRIGGGGGAPSSATPLSTIHLIARELEHVVERDSPHADDVKMFLEQGSAAGHPGEI